MKRNHATIVIVCAWAALANSCGRTVGSTALRTGALEGGATIYRVVDGIGAAEAELPSSEIGDTTSPVHDWLDVAAPSSGAFSGASAGRLMRSDPDDANHNPTFAPPVLQFHFRVAVPDSYALYVRASGVSTGSDSLAMRLTDADGMVLSSTSNITVAPNNNGTWGWYTNSTLTRFLAPADYTIEVAMRESGVAIDKVVLQAAAHSPPSGVGPMVTPLVVDAHPGFVVRDGSGAAEAEHFSSIVTDPSVPLHLWAEHVAPAVGTFSGALNGAYMQAEPDIDPAAAAPAPPYLIYRFRVPVGGASYRVYLRGAGANNGANSAHAEILSAEGDVLDSMWANFGAAGSWTWGATASATLENANYLVRVSFREDGVAVDRVVLQLSSLPAPSGAGPVETIDESTPTPGLCGPQTGEWGGCTEDCPCSEGGGSCAENGTESCLPGLVCGEDNGGAFGLAQDVDACWGAHCENGVLDGDETGIDCGGDCGWCIPPTTHATVELAPGGIPLPIYVDAGASDALNQSVDHLAATLESMTGLEFSVSRVSALPSGSYIAVGTNGSFGGADWPFSGAFSTDAFDQMDHVMWSTNVGMTRRLYLAGASSPAAIRSIARLLRSLGYYHLMPTDEWEIIPEDSSPSINASDLVRPRFLTTTFWASGGNWTDDPEPYMACDGTDETSTDHRYYCELWRWQRHNGIEAEDDGLFIAGHSYGTVIKEWSDHYTCMVGSSPVAPTFPTALLTPAPSSQKFCLTTLTGAPTSGTASVRDYHDVDGDGDTTECVFREFDVAEIISEYSTRYFEEHPDEVSLPMGPSDGVSDWDSGSTCGDDAFLPNISDRIVQVANWAADVRPDRVVTTLAYSAGSAAPSFAPAPNVMVFVATDYDLVTHSSPLERVRDWYRSGARVVGLRSYFAIHQAAGLGGRDQPNSETSRLTEFSDLIRGFRDHGGRALIGEGSVGFAPTAISYWLLARTLTDAPGTAVDADGAREEFVSAAFGHEPSVVPHMLAFYERLTGRALVSLVLLHDLYASLAAAYAEATEETSRVRIRDMILYVHYLELDRAYRMQQRECGLEPDPEQRLAAMRESFESLRRWSFSIRDRWLTHDRAGYCSVNYAFNPQSDFDETFVLENTRDPHGAVELLIPDARNECAASAHCGAGDENEWKCDAPPTVSDIEAYLADGLAVLPELPFGPVEFDMELVPANVPHPSGLARMTDAEGFLDHTGPTRWFTWLDSTPGTFEYGAQVYPGEFLTASMVSAWDPSVVQSSHVVPGGTHEGLLAESNYGGLHWVDFRAMSHVWSLDTPPGNPMVIVATVGGENEPALHHRWGMYFYVPAGTTTVGGWAERDRVVDVWRRTGTTWVHAQELLSDHVLVDPSLEVCHDDPADDDIELLREYFAIDVEGDGRGEIWSLNKIGAGDVVLMTTPPELARHPTELMLPRNVVDADIEVSSPVYP